MSDAAAEGALLPRVPDLSERAGDRETGKIMGLKNAAARCVTWLLSRVSQVTTVAPEDGRTTDPAFAQLLRRAAAESCVLLKNDGVLPFGTETVSVFGRCQRNYFYAGYGSGGDVKAPYRVPPAEGFRNAGLRMNGELLEIYRKWTERNPPYEGFWGHWPMCYDEMPVSRALARKAAEKSDAAVVILGRSSGEDRESREKRGSMYLTKREERMLENVCAAFRKVCVVLNCGVLPDLSFLETYAPGAVLVAWQGGQESGNALADVLTGKVNPSGHLPDTAAPLSKIPGTRDFTKGNRTEYREDIYVGYRYFETFDRDSVYYPFGFGLSYTTFSVRAEKVFREGTRITAETAVKNTGTRAGRGTAQLYLKTPGTVLGAPERQLVRFRKTAELAPGEEEKITFSFRLEEFASYDDGGACGTKDAFVLEAGHYEVYLGENVRVAAKVFETDLAELLVTERASSACAPEKPFDRLVRKDGRALYEPSPAGNGSRKERILSSLPTSVDAPRGAYVFADFEAGRVTAEELAASLSEEELEAITRGSLESMWAAAGAPGNAGILGGVSEGLREKGVMALSCHDGPSGVRINGHASMLPVGTALAAAFDPDLVEELVSFEAGELLEMGGHVLLAPGMNIHRNPLCGRNFEYFSEDPYLTGKTAAAYVRGVQKTGGSAVIKHFACNNRETGRTVSDSVVSARALREIYLKGFRMAVEESEPDFVMSSYNKVNGVYSYYNYDLCTQILRKEWGFAGTVMTDWWMRTEPSPEFPAVTGQAYRVRAGADVFMPGSAKTGKYRGKSDGTLLASLHEKDGITRAELETSAARVLRSVLKHTGGRKGADR